MIHHYQDELQTLLEKSADFFGISDTSIYTQFVVMLGTLSFLSFGSSMSLFVLPSALQNYEWLHYLSVGFGITAKFFTTCVGAIATLKFTTSVIKSIKEKFSNKKK